MSLVQIRAISGRFAEFAVFLAAVVIVVAGGAQLLLPHTTHSMSRVFAYCVSLVYQKRVTGRLAALKIGFGARFLTVLLVRRTCW